MNYLAHGHRFLDRPVFLAGTALPDWLRVCGRRIPSGFHGDPRAEADRDAPAGELAAGLDRHLADDAAFHSHPAFLRVSGEITGNIRGRFPEERRLRAHFLGHALAEMLLDAALIELQPELLDAYYAALGDVDPQLIQRSVNRWLREPTERLSAVVEFFRQRQFLKDYLCDDRLMVRLEQVTARVGLPELPRGFEASVADARELVARNARALLSFSGPPGRG